MKSGALRVGRVIRKFAGNFSLELFAWCGLLLAPLFINPSVGNYPSICLFHALGIEFCPGCGLGRALALLYRGDLISSFMTHPLAIFFVLITGFRIITLVGKSVENFNQRIGVSHG